MEKTKTRGLPSIFFLPFSPPLPLLLLSCRGMTMIFQGRFRTKVDSESTESLSPVKLATSNLNVACGLASSSSSIAAVSLAELKGR